MKNQIFVLFSVIHVIVQIQSIGQTQSIGSNKNISTYTLAPFETKIIQGEYTLSSKLVNRNLDVMFAKKEIGTGLHIWDINNGEAQRFRIEKSNEPGYYYIKTIWGKCLSVNGHDLSKLLTWDCIGNDNTKWKFIATGDGYYNIQSKLGTYIDVRWAKKENGSEVGMSGYSNWENNIAQRWKLNELDNRPKLVKIRLRNIFMAEDGRLEQACPHEPVAGAVWISLWKSEEHKGFFPTEIIPEENKNSSYFERRDHSFVAKPITRWNVAFNIVTVEEDWRFYKIDPNKWETNDYKLNVEFNLGVVHKDNPWASSGGHWLRQGDDRIKVEMILPEYLNKDRRLFEFGKSPLILQKNQIVLGPYVTPTNRKHVFYLEIEAKLVE